jgi:replicative DNA helicase
MKGLQPHSKELEEIVIGTILLQKETLLVHAELLFEELFYLDANRNIFRAMKSLQTKNMAVDIVTVTQELKAMHLLETVGGSYYISSCTNRIISDANMEYHLRILHQYYVRRNAIQISHQVIAMAEDEMADPLNDLLAMQEKNLTDMMNRIVTGKTYEAIDVHIEMIKHLNALEKANTDMLGVDTGFQRLNTLTGGWQKTDLIIVAARPGMGKTSFVLNTVQAALKRKKPVAFFSCEMSRLQLYARMCSQTSQIELEFFLKSKMSSDIRSKFNHLCDELSNSPIYIDDRPGVDIHYIKSKARKLKREKNIEMVVVDYLQLIELGKSHRSTNDGIGEISRQLKFLAKELDIPVICLSQLSRDVDKRPGSNKRPVLSDLRDSGNIEQDADIVMFIYRPEYYGITADEDNESTAGKAALIVAKHRNGGLDNVIVGFDGKCTNFYDLLIF